MFDQNCVLFSYKQSVVIVVLFWKLKILPNTFIVTILTIFYLYQIICIVLWYILYYLVHTQLLFCSLKTIFGSMWGFLKTLNIHYFTKTFSTPDLIMCDLFNIFLVLERHYWVSDIFERCNLDLITLQDRNSLLTPLNGKKKSQILLKYVTFLTFFAYL